MSDAFDNYLASPTSVQPLTRAIIAAMPTTMSGGVVGPCFSDGALRSMLDALNNIESRLAAASL